MPPPKLKVLETRDVSGGVGGGMEEEEKEVGGGGGARIWRRVAEAADKAMMTGVVWAIGDCKTLICVLAGV